MPRGANDSESLARIAAFQRGLQQWGWTERHNVRIDTLWAGGSAEAIRKHSAELAALAPILAHGGTTVGPLLTTISAVPIVFVSVTDPVGAGFVVLARCELPVVSQTSEIRDDREIGVYRLPTEVELIVIAAQRRKPTLGGCKFVGLLGKLRFQIVKS
jgi:hypothetical protein